MPEDKRPERRLLEGEVGKRCKPARGLGDTLAILGQSRCREKSVFGRFFR
jgi:hypothetical protein